MLWFGSMNLIMAVGAKRDQILPIIIAKPAAEANVVNLKILRGPTILASPSITFEYLRANSTICCRIQPASIVAAARISLWSFDLLEEFRLLWIGKQRVESAERREP